MAVSCSSPSTSKFKDPFFSNENVIDPIIKFGKTKEFMHLFIAE